MEPCAYKAFIFDCDGTILDTLGDLVALTNITLAEFNMPAHTREEILSYVGFGAARLIDQAVAENTPPDVAQAVLNRWRELYPTYGYTFTRPYSGIPEALAALRGKGCALGVVSNKFDAATREVCNRFFEGVFDAVHGEGPGFPRKPDPAGLLTTCKELGVLPEQTVYVGDSPVDMQVAVAAGCVPVGVAWGYNPPQVLKHTGASRILTHPQHLLDLL